ncbi:MAG: transglutaminase domain-containing protein [Hydrogenophaga sp.]|uniref:transglutaminase domain-containing protein n=1 Tax=Hydrogenophaga sp. TaxID=1904254 RepID=UPI00260CBF0A|nr:transglutaminase domain-containing protein [Hydrogenophaga sp.]MCW5668917.1 transglutaminase domain-containing protein [Hydrogenophaga sp.]
MLVATQLIVVDDGRRNVWKYLFWVGLLAALLAVFSLAPFLIETTNVVKLRNALLLRDADDVRFQWTPAEAPVDFKWEQGPADPYFVAIAERLRLAEMPDDWSRAVTISSHLLTSSGKKLRGGAIKTDLRRTYERITRNGDGYCGDFVRVFMAIAIAGGMQVRPWAFSFDGFGGHGHIWPEIWNRQTKDWQLVGVFNNYYFFEDPGVPLSALEFRQALMEGADSLKLAPLDPAARVGWKYEEKAWAYYRRGLPQWYLWWGNDVFTYDRAGLVRLFDGVSRPLEQFGGVIQDVSPRLQVLLTPENRPQVEAMMSLKHRIWSTISVLMVALTTIVVSLLCWRPWSRRVPRGTA